MIINKKEYFKQYYIANKDRLRKLGKSYYIKNKDKLDKQIKEYKLNNVVKYRKYNRNRLLQIGYNITIEQYNEMFSRQNGKCAICGVHQSKLKKTLGVDHNHKTGINRKLLCCSCNIGLGMFKESMKILENAFEYLKRYDSVGEEKW